MFDDLKDISLINSVSSNIDYSGFTDIEFDESIDIELLYKDFPERMKPLNMNTVTRERLSNPRFWQCKFFSLTPEEKLWLCEQADNRIETTSYA